MSFDCSMFCIFGSCDTKMLHSLASGFPTHRPMIDIFINVIEPWEEQKLLLDDIITDLTALAFPDLIPRISKYMGVRKPTNEEDALVRQMMDRMDPLSAIGDSLTALSDLELDDLGGLDDPGLKALALRLEDNLQTMANIMELPRVNLEVVWTWGKLKKHYDMVCDKLSVKSILDRFYEALNADKPPDAKLRPKDYFQMPKELKEAKFELVCSDGVSFEVEAKAAWEIGFIRNFVEDNVNALGTKIKMPESITSANLKLVTEFCARNVSRKRPRSDGASSSDATLEPLPNNLERRQIFELHQISEHLLIESLLEWTARRIASMIRDKSVAEILEILDLKTGIVRDASVQ